MVRNILLIGLLNVCTSLCVSCTGGCWLKADEVRTEPSTPCLALFAGNPDNDHRVCAVPNLGGVNNCSEALTLPKLYELGEAVVVAPGGKVAWRLPSESVPQAVTITNPGSGKTEYAINASLGNQSITITVPVHDI